MPLAQAPGICKSPRVHSFTTTLTPQQAQKLEHILQERGWTFRDVPHSRFAASGPQVQVVVYNSGKCVVQGKGTRDFVEYTLEPVILERAQLGYEQVLNPEIYEEHIGVDESGKGDFFGPLVITGVHAKGEAIHKLIETGVKDSKRISSDKVLDELAKTIRAIPGVTEKTLVLQPTKYNELQKKMGTVNQVLGWAHATVAKDLFEQHPQCKRVVFDQFARDDRVILRYLGPHAEGREVVQRHRAEQDPVVAAASILARRTFLKNLALMSRGVGEQIPLGASATVKLTAARLLEKYGSEHLSRMVKTHFKTWAELVARPLPGL